MPVIDPYLAAPTEPRPRPRLDGARAFLGLLVVILLVAAGVLVSVVNARQDPSLLVPAGQGADIPAQESGGIPVAPPLDTAD